MSGKNLTRENVTLGAFVLFIIILAVQVVGSTQRNNGEFIYPIDDTYIHLAIARNFSDHGIWGIDRYAFSSTSSSLLYGGSLSVLLNLLGDVPILPLILNLLFAIALFFIFYRMADEDNISPPVYLLTCVSLVLLMPLPSMVLSGMEHVLHAILSISFSVFAARNLVSRERSLASLLIITPLIATVRYEGLFLVGIAAFLFFINRRFRASAVVLLMGLAPIIIFGIISINNGSHFLPNTILAKSDASSLAGGSMLSFILHTAENFLYHITRLFMTVPIVVCGILLYCLRDQKRSFAYQLVVITLLLLLSHCAFARVGRFARYEAYLMAQTVVCIMYGYHPLKDFLNQLGRRKWVTSLIVILLLAPGVKRSFKNYNRSVQASHNIYEQQFQMAHFVKSLPQKVTLMANDIGALAYFNPDLKIVDMVGLGSVDVLNMIKSVQGDEAIKQGYVQIASNHSADIAIIYDHWFRGRIPEEWTKVETWTIGNNVICGHETVSFYSLKPELTGLIMCGLKQFRLPGSVVRSKQSIQPGSGC